MADKAELARQRQMRKEIEARQVKLERAGAVMSKEEQKLRKKQERQVAVASKSEAAAVRQEFADKEARRQALMTEEKAKFDRARGPPPKTLVGEIGDWYSEVVAKQVDYATCKANEAREMKRREQEEARRLAKPDGQPARYHWTHPSPLLLNKLARIMDTHTIPESSSDSASWISTATTLVVAARQGDVEAVIRMLAGKGAAKTTGEIPLNPRGKAGVEVLRPDAEGISPVMWAAWKGRNEIVRLLLDAKADLYAASHTGAFPLCVFPRARAHAYLRACLPALPVCVPPPVRVRAMAPVRASVRERATPVTAIYLFPRSLAGTWRRRRATWSACAR
jgi:hypothetical protein